MVSVCFYFQVHQPPRLRKYSIFEIGHHNNYFDERKNEAIIKKDLPILNDDRGTRTSFLLCRECAA